MNKLHTFFVACFQSVLGLASLASAQDKELNLYAWSEYVPQGVIDGFTEETGVRVNYETYASNEEMLQKLLSGATKYDLIQPSEYTIEALIKEGKLAELDKSKLPNLKNLAPEYTNMAFDPGQKHSVPWMAGTVGIVVNTETIKDPIKGYKDVFQPKHKGKIVALDDARELVTWVLYSKGMDINKITPEVLEQVRPQLGEWMSYIKVYDSDSPKTALLNGDVDLGVVWSGEAALLYNEDKKFQYVIPAEGTHLFIDSLAIPKDSPNKEAAHAFINYILRPEVSKLISTDFPYTNPNAEARKLLSPEELANPASYPKDVEGKLHTFHDIGKAASDIDELVTDLKASQ